MKLSQLEFHLPRRLLEDIASKKQEIAELSDELAQIGQAAGTDNPRFRRAKQTIEKAIEDGKPLSNVLSSRIEVRALALTLTELSENEAITLNEDAINAINRCLNHKL